LAGNPATGLGVSADEASFLTPGRTEDFQRFRSFMNAGLGCDVAFHPVEASMLEQQRAVKNRLAWFLRSWWFMSSNFLTHAGECLSEACCAEDFYDAPKVVSHDGDADFRPASPRSSRRGWPKMRYLIVPKGCSTVVLRSLMAAGVARAFIRFNASSSMLRETQYFPDLKVGDIEVIADYADHKVDPHAVIQDYVQFTRLFERATGTKLVFFHSDIAWRTNWHPTFLLAAQCFRAEGIRFGAVIG